MWPSFTMAMEALGTLVDDKIWLAAASILDFKSSGSAAAVAPEVDCARSPGLIASNTRVSSDFSMLARL
jgi:hypothetical protein